MADKHLAELLRDCANTEPGPLHPHWANEAQRLMRWAADALLAAEYALDDYRRRRGAQETPRAAEVLQKPLD